MAGTAQWRGTFRFGVFELNPEAGELRKQGLKLKLQDQPLRLLAMLLEHPGEIVSREEIQKKLWPEDTYVDFDNSINSSVRKLRDVLGDNPESPRFIETLPRRGYRFIADVHPLTQLSKPENAGPHHPVTQSNPSDAGLPFLVPPAPKEGLRRLNRWSIAGLALLTVVTASAGYYFISKRVAKEPFFYASSPLTNYLGSEMSPSFSPDGGRVAFAWDGENQDNFDIYVKQIGVESPLRLTNDPRPDVSPAWSPDGRTIAFMRRVSEDRGEILLIPSIGEGSARSLATVATVMVLPRSLAWSPDSKWLAVPDGDAGGGVIGLVLLSVETGEKRKLTIPPVNDDDYDPAFSPDGRQLVFVRYTGGTVGDLYVLKLSTSLRPQTAPERLTFANRPTVNPVWTEDGKEILFSRYEEGPSQSLWRINVTGDRRVTSVHVAGDNIFGLALSKQGSLVYTRDTSTENIWAVTLKGERGGPSIGSRAWSDSSWQDGTPQYSPDGQQVAFQSARSGKGEIWIAEKDGSHPRQVTNLRDAVMGFPRWSPDGKNIAFHSRPQRNAIIYVIAASGGSPRRMTDESEDDVTPSWSRDGKWIYFWSRKTGEDQVWKVPAKGGPEIQVTRRGGRVPLESLDGKYLYYTKTEHSALWRMPVGGGEETQLATDIAAEGSSYAPGKTGVYFIRSSTGTYRPELAVFRLDGGRTTSICPIPGSVTLGLSISPDESRVLYARTQLSSDLMIVENFR